MSGKRVAVIALGVGAVAATVGLVAYFIIKNKSETSTTDGVIIDTTGGDSTATTTGACTGAESVIGKSYYIKAPTGKYFSARSGNTLNLVAQHSDWEVFLFEKSNKIDGDVMMKSVKWNKYVSARNTGKVTVQQPKPDTWESFSINCSGVDSAGLPRVSLLGYHGKYLGMNAANIGIGNTATAVSDNEMFSLVPV